MEKGINLIQIVMSYFPLWCTCFIFVMPQKHKEMFWIRYSMISIVFLSVGVLTNVINLGNIGSTVISYVISIFTFWVLSDNKWKEVIYCSIWSVFIQKLIVGIWGLCLGSLGEANNVTFYSNELIYILFVVSVCIIIGFTLARFMPVEGAYHIGPRQFASSVLFVVIFEIFDYILRVNDFISNNIQLAALIIGAQFYCVTVLYLQEALFVKSSIKQELNTINFLWKRQKEQYDLSKENIQIINQKCHDLKHQILAFRLMSQENEKNDFLKEIENSVGIYDSIIYTQNEALDVILTEKSLYCQANSIHINCVVDGSQMGFIAPVDLYTVFGNALDNAIEGVIKINNKNKRFIDVMIHVKQKFLIINIINPIEQDINFKSALPISTKPNNGYHGYGLKSIRHTISKYNGFMTIDTKDHCFVLSMLIPVPKQEKRSLSRT